MCFVGNLVCRSTQYHREHMVAFSNGRGKRLESDCRHPFPPTVPICCRVEGLALPSLAEEPGCGESLELIRTGEDIGRARDRPRALAHANGLAGGVQRHQ